MSEVTSSTVRFDEDTRKRLDEIKASLGASSWNQALAQIIKEYPDLVASTKKMKATLINKALEQAEVKEKIGTYFSSLEYLQKYYLND